MLAMNSESDLWCDEMRFALAWYDLGSLLVVKDQVTNLPKAATGELWSRHCLSFILSKRQARPQKSNIYLCVLPGVWGVMGGGGAG